MNKHINVKWTTKHSLRLSNKRLKMTSIVREMINGELTSDVSPTNWAKIEGIAIAMQDLSHYLATDDWTNALTEINNYV